MMDTNVMTMIASHLGNDVDTFLCVDKFTNSLKYSRFAFLNWVLRSNINVLEVYKSPYFLYECDNRAEIVLEVLKLHHTNNEMVLFAMKKAAAYGHDDVMEALLTMQTCFVFYHDVLVDATKHDRFNIINLLLSERYNVHPNLALRAAALVDSWRSAHHILSMFKVTNLEEVIQFACSSNKISLLQVLLHAYDGNTPLYEALRCAIYFNHEEIVHLLLQNVIDIDIESLRLAVVNANINILTMLIEHGASTEHMFTFAMHFGSKKVLDLLTIRSNKF